MISKVYLIKNSSWFSFSIHLIGQTRCTIVLLHHWFNLWYVFGTCIVLDYFLLGLKNHPLRILVKVISILNKLLKFIISSVDQLKMHLTINAFKVLCTWFDFLESYHSDGYSLAYILYTIPWQATSLPRFRETAYLPTIMVTWLVNNRTQIKLKQQHWFMINLCENLR